MATTCAWARVQSFKFSMMDDLEERAHRTLFELTLRDPLTRLYNRRYFDERLLSEFGFAQRHNTQLAILLLDIDHFKRFNDAWGHQVGDVVLKIVAKYPKHDAPRRCTCALWG